MSDVAERTSVIVPAFNEAHAIGQLVSQLQAAARWATAGRGGSAAGIV